jgi:hypothetical protein
VLAVRARLAVLAPTPVPPNRRCSVPCARRSGRRCWWPDGPTLRWPHALTPRRRARGPAAARAARRWPARVARVLADAPDRTTSLPGRRAVRRVGRDRTPAVDAAAAASARRDAGSPRALR